MENVPPRLEPKLLYRRLDSLLGAFDPRRPVKQLLEAFLKDAFHALRDDLRLRSAALFTERREGFALVSRAGEDWSLAETLDASQPPLSLACLHGVYLFDAPLEAPSAGLVIGARPERHALFFALTPEREREEVDFALNTIRAALSARLADERVRVGMRQAAEIQQSLLMEEPPPFPGFEIAARSVPAEEVGGDFFDFLPLDGDVLGLAIGDASGHGLPAALLVRDIVTGLRMGIEKDLKITPVFERLNRVIHRSRLSSRFVSLFYGELESSGSLVYVNAGHPPPLLFSNGGVETLAVGGTVVGPLPEARFRRGIARLQPGDLLAMCTDGILERRRASGEFGEDGLRRTLEALGDAPVETLLEGVFSAAFRHGEERPWDDDATALVVRRKR